VKVLGVDPGSRLVGYGCIAMAGGESRFLTSGVIDVRSAGDLASRLAGIHLSVLAVIDEQRPDVLALEEVFYSRNVPSLVRIGEGRGVVLLAAALRGVPVVQYTPAVVKKALTGSGAARKEQVAAMVRRILGRSDLPGGLDATDALALAICHVHRHNAPGVAEAAHGRRAGNAIKGAGGPGRSPGPRRRAGGAGRGGRGRAPF
jgi:crossover junction endodeoxyribonuclease RuvC